MKSQKILVTGGAGYIGSHTVLRLLESGYDVVVFDSLERGHIETIDTLRGISRNVHSNFEFVKGDLKNFADISGVFELHKDISAVIHFAAYICVEESVKDPQKYYLNNVGGSLNLLKAMRSHSVDKIVFSSTAAVYGNPAATTTQSLTEDSSLAPINPYGKSKLMVENILQDFGVAYGTNSVVLRYFNVVGADSLARIGEWHEPETHLIPKILAAAMSDEDVESGGSIFKIFGDDFDTPDGTCVRDYVNVEDLAEAHIKALGYLCSCTRDCQKNTSCFNIGTDTGNSVKEILDKCEFILGKKIERKVLSRRIGDPAFLVANTKKARKVLGWNPKRSLEDSISSAYKWYKRLKNKRS